MNIARLFNNLRHEKLSNGDERNPAEVKKVGLDSLSSNKLVDDLIKIFSF